MYNYVCIYLCIWGLHPKKRQLLVVQFKRDGCCENPHFIYKSFGILYRRTFIREYLAIAHHINLFQSVYPKSPVGTSPRTLSSIYFTGKYLYSYIHPNLKEKMTTNFVKQKIVNLLYCDFLSNNGSNYTSRKQSIYNNILLVLSPTVEQTHNKQWRWTIQPT